MKHKEIPLKCFPPIFQVIYDRITGTKKAQKAVIIESDVMDESQLRESVKATSGFSGREIGKLMIAIQGAIHSSEKGRLSRLDCQRVIDSKVREHHQKLNIKKNPKW
jgi:ATPase family AAA domain-containing protein 3A/B